MQTDRRHELEENVLAEKTVEVFARLRPYTNTVLGIGAVACVAVVATIVISAQVAAGRVQSWDSCFVAMSSGDPEAFADVILQYPGTAAAQWSQLILADMALNEGAELLFVNRERADTKLREAVELYDTVIADKPQGMRSERAVFGLAKARESLGQLDSANKGYAVVAAEFSTGGLSNLAFHRAAALERESTRQWYEWFAAQNMSPPEKPGAVSNPSVPTDAAIDSPVQKE